MNLLNREDMAMTGKLVKHEYEVIKPFWLTINKKKQSYQISDTYKRNSNYKVTKLEDKIMWTEWKLGAKFFDYENDELKLHKSTHGLAKKKYIEFVKSGLWY